MLSLSELLNPSFLLFLGISMLAIALLVLYFESKFRDQNHKIASMLSLVSSLAEELNGVKMRVNVLSMHGGNISIPQQPVHLMNHPVELKSDLITVSDDDSDSDDDSEEYDELEADESDSESEDLEDNIIEIGETVNPKIFKLLKLNNDNDNDNDNELDELDDIQSSNSDVSLKNNQLIIDQLEDNDLQELQVVEPLSSTLDLKTIDISNLEKDNEDISTSDKVDYKKLPIGKLKSIVSEKGLASDPSKLKKPDLLKLLGVE